MAGLSMEMDNVNRHSLADLDLLLLQTVDLTKCVICDCVNFLFTERNVRVVQVLRVLIPHRKRI